MAAISSKAIYRAAPGAHFDDKEAQKIGRELESIGTFPNIDQDQVIEKARSRKSVLHRYFEWDDQQAAGHWRRYQARKILASLVVEVEGADQPVRAFHSVHIETAGGERRVFAHIGSVSRSSAEQIIEKAAAELAQWQLRYEAYRDHFAAVFDAIDATRAA